MEKLLLQLSHIEENTNRQNTQSKLNPQVLLDLQQSATAVRSDIPLSYCSRRDAWNVQRREMKEKQILLARASDQQEQLDKLSESANEKSVESSTSVGGVQRGGGAGGAGRGGAPAAAQPATADAPPPFGGIASGGGAGGNEVMSASLRRRARRSVMVQRLEYEGVDGTDTPPSSAMSPASLRRLPPTDKQKLHTDLLNAANQRRINRLYRKLDEEKARLAENKQKEQQKTLLRQQHKSRDGDLDALLALERELLAEAGALDSLAGSLPPDGSAAPPSLFKQASVRGNPANNNNNNNNNNNSKNSASSAAMASAAAMPTRQPGQRRPTLEAAHVVQLQQMQQQNQLQPSPAPASDTASAAPAVTAPSDVKLVFVLQKHEHTLRLPLTTTLAAARRQAHAAFEAQAIKTLRSVDAYMLFADDFLANEQEQLARTPYIVLCRAKGVRPRITFVTVTAYKLFVQQIHAVTGISQQDMESKSGEAAFFRKRMAEQRLLDEYGALRAMMSSSNTDKDDNKKSNASLPAHLPTEVSLKLHLSAVRTTGVRCPARQTVGEVLRNAVSQAGGQMPPHTKPNAVPPWLLKIAGRHNFLLDFDEPIALNEHVREQLRDGVQEVELVLVETQRCRPSMAASLSRLVLARRTREAVVRSDAALTADQRLAIEASNAQLFEDAENNAPGAPVVTDVSECERRMRVRMMTVEAVNTQASGLKKLIKDKSKVWASVQLYCSGIPIGEEVQTEPTYLASTINWMSWLELSPYRDIPWSAVMQIQLQAYYKKKDVTVCLGWANHAVFGYNDRVRHGTHRIHLRTDDNPDPLAPSGNAPLDGPLLVFETEILSTPVGFRPGWTHQCSLMPRRPPHVPSKVARERVDALLERNALVELTDSERVQVWSQRGYCRTRSCSVAKFLDSIPWAERSNVVEAYRVLREWEVQLKPVDALLVFGSSCVDKVVRMFGVRMLDHISDTELANYLLQLVAALKHEPHHYSPLAAFLVRRGLGARHTLGRRLYWLLKAEIHEEQHKERFGLIIEAYLRGCSREERDELLRQHELNERLRDAAIAAQDTKRDERQRVVVRELEAINDRLQDRDFSLPLDSAMRCRALIVNDCKSLDSKTMPLWLSLKNDDVQGDPILTIFKAGDDLRQDQLTLQMMHLMDLMWLDAGLDLRTINYKCVATGPEIGWIEVVLNCQTTADIQLAAGGVKAAFSEKPLSKWLRKQNPLDGDLERAVENLVRSCAASCVATYVLGVCDRHNDNIMITKDGRLFHIDFGKFLGNAQMFGAFRRDRAPFVLTPEFVYAMGGKESRAFERFCDMACRAYNVVRANAHVFIALFSMMVSTGIPELQSVDDLDYLQEALSLGLSEADAAALFRQLIDESLNTKATTFNFAIHLAARPD